MKFKNYTSVKFIIPVLLASFVLMSACLKKVNPPKMIFKDDYSGNLPLDRLQLPEGFKIDVYAEGIVNARSMAYSENGTLFVGTRNEGNVYALKDTDGDYRADEVITLLSGLTLPNGVALLNGDLYIAEVNRILKISDIENNLKEEAPYEVINDSWMEIHRFWP